jgi:hypothetical protein
LITDNVVENLPWPDRGKLIDVADEQERRPSGDPLGERKHQRDVDNAGFGDQEQISVERIVGAAAKAAGLASIQQRPDERRLRVMTTRSRLGRAGLLYRRIQSFQQVVRQQIGFV